MKKFVFSLETLLKLRRWEEQVARQALVESDRRVAESELSVAKALEAEQSIFNAWGGSNRASFKRDERLSLDAALSSAENALKEARDHLGEARLERREAMNSLARAIRARKVVEDLKTRRYELHLIDANRREAIEVEDVFNARINERKNQLQAT